MSELADVAFAVFALQQPVSLDEMAAPARERRLIMASANTPGWFAAAASSSNLPDIAPELTAHQSGSQLERHEGMDLVWLYAPELRELEPQAPGIPAQEADRASSAQPSASRTTDSSVHIGLLRQLSDFDS